MPTKSSLLIILSMLLASQAMAGEGAGTEFRDRDVDSAALSAQEQAIAGIESMIGGPGAQSPELLYRLAELRQQSAEMRFRVAHGRAQKTGKPVDLGAYRADLKASISPLDRLISRFPRFDEIGHAYFMRAKAYDENGDKKAATRDYLHVVKRFAKGSDAMAAYLALAEISIAQKKHPQAIAYLDKIAARPADSHYPVALYHLAWSHYSIGHIKQCLTNAEKLRAHLKARPAGAERGMLEALTDDVPGFYFTAFERDLPRHNTARALDFFRRYADQPVLGKMAVQYAYLLRTRGYEQDLRAWKGIMLAAYPNSPESHEVLLATYEYQLSRGDYAAVAKSAQDIAKVASTFKETEVSAKAEKLLIDSTKGLQRLLAENQHPERARELLTQLAYVYEAFSRVVKDGDPRLRTFHLNLAETLFSIKDYAKAADNYRWILAHGGYKENSGGISGTTASLKAISSRYEQLKAAKLIPTVLKPTTLGKGDKDADPRLREWIDWIDDHVAHAGRGLTDSFEFDSYRALYFNGQVNEAMKRLRALALAAPKSPVAIPAATLVMDTYIANAAWKKVEESSIEFLAVDAWKGTPFSKWAYKTGADAKYKHAEHLARSKDFDDAIEEADELQKKFPQSPQLVNALTLAGNAAVAMKNRQLAIEYYDKLAHNARDKETVAKARLSIAQLEEERFNFAGAANAYLTYLKIPASARKKTQTASDAEIKRRILLFAWLGGTADEVGALTSNRTLCTGPVRAECDKYRVLKHLMADSDDVPAQTSQLAARQARVAPPRFRAVWAAIALDNVDRLPYATRRQMIQVLARDWKHADAMTRFALIPRISESVPRSFELDRENVERSSKLALTQRAIKRRVSLIVDLEKTATRAAALPWLHIRSKVIGEMAMAYLDLASGLRELPMPKGLTESEKREFPRMIGLLVAPHERKAQALRAEAGRLASRSGDDLDLDLIRSVDPRGRWGSVDYDTAEAGQVLRSRWAAALGDRNWRQVAFFVNQAQASQQGAAIPAGVVGVARAVSLAATGARAEGSLELSDLCRSHRREGIRSACSM